MALPPRRPNNVICGISNDVLASASLDSEAPTKPTGKPITAAGIGAPAARASGAARGSGAKRRSMQAVQRLRIVERDAAAALALEEYSLLALEDEEENLRQLLHEVDATLPLTTRRSGLSQAKPLPTSPGETTARHRLAKLHRPAR